MICKKCGSNQSDDAKFCSNCGFAIEYEIDIEMNTVADNKPIENQTSNEPENTIPKQTNETDNEFKNAEEQKKATITEKIKGSIKSFWDNLDLFCKIGAISIVAAILLLFIALCKGKILPIIISALQLGGLAVSLFIHKGKIKCDLNWIKYAILAVSIIFTGLNFSSYSWLNNAPMIDNSEPTKLSTPYSAQECIKKDKNAVENDFLSVGFYNIEKKPIKDLEPNETDKIGKVSDVTINGVTDFNGNAEFNSSSKIIIKYHSFKEIAVPFSSEEVKTMDTETVLRAFEEAGFFKISTDERYDLDPDTTTAEFENTISIDGINTFEKGEEYSPDSNIEFVIHRPYEKYTLKVVINFIPNLIFSKYDVKLEIGEYSEKLTHGNNAKFEYRLKQGKYTLMFTSVESSSVKGSIELALNGDTEACYTISCTSEKIDIETQYVENKSAVGENEAMVPLSSSNCKNKNYKDIEKAFRDAGFTNIKTSVLYDIYWNITNEGDVDSVVIDGKTSFTRGDIFANDAAIVITYHMKEEDDPNKKQETASVSTENVKSNETSTNNADVYSDFKHEAQAKRAFEKYGELTYPHGIKYHWFGSQISEYEDNGIWYFKVEATITNAFNAKRNVVAEGRVDFKKETVSEFQILDSWD